MKNLKVEKKYIVASAVIIGSIIIVLILVSFVKKAIMSDEDKMIASLEELGEKFYEELYYVQQSQDENKRTENLERFKDLGIKVNLDTLTRFRTSEENEEALKKFVNPNTNEECDKYSSMVTIYPKSPYKKTDYKIEAYLVCGFEKEKEEEPQKEINYPPKEDEENK